MAEKNLELDRLVFFSDAVIAIAITLLALDLKIDNAPDHHLTFTMLADSWEKFLAFFISFYGIAVFWRIHHNYFSHIKDINRILLRYNLCWLLCIVLLPFTTSLMSEYFEDTAAIFMYCFNVLCVTLFQTLMWNYVTSNSELLKNDTPETTIREYQFGDKVAMVNSIAATGLSFISPLAAVIVLSLRPLIIAAAITILRPKLQAK